MKKFIALVLTALLVALVLPVGGEVVPATNTKARVVVGVAGGFDFNRAKNALGWFGSIEMEMPEIGAIVITVPKNAIENIRRLTFVRYVEEDVLMEISYIDVSSKPSGGVNSKPRVRITDYTKELTVTAGSQGEVLFTIKNVGKVDALTVVELRDERGVLIARTGTITLPAGVSYSGRLGFTAPNTAGTYNWTLAVVDSSDSRVVYASATVVVNVTASNREPAPSPPPPTTYNDTITWNIQMINTTKVWSTSSQYGDSAYGQHATIQLAIIDTGVDYRHQDLEDTIMWCVVSLNNTLYMGGDISQCADLNGHGTHVTGIAAARLNNWGIAGVAPKVVVYVVKAFDSSGRGYSSDIARGLVEVVKGPDGVVGTDDDADVISMSFGGGYSSVLYEAIMYAYNVGVVLVASAGNSGASTPLYPAAHPEVIAVGAVDRYYSVPSWSNRNPDVVAPGSGVLSTWLDNKHIIASGTSMACPHVSAAVSLAQAVRLASGKQKLMPQQVIELVRTTAVDLGPTGYDQESGYGLVDAYTLVLSFLET